GVACAANAECVHTCIAGTCAPLAGYNAHCDDTTDCEAGLTCTSAGICKIADGAACSANAECASVCVGGVCGAKSGTNGPCDETADCVAGNTCVLGECLEDDGGACTANTQCAHVCIKGTCAAKSGSGGTCDDAEDCTSGLSCLDGKCLFDAGGA